MWIPNVTLWYKKLIQILGKYLKNQSTFKTLPLLSTEQLSMMVRNTMFKSKYLRIILCGICECVLMIMWILSSFNLRN